MTRYSLWRILASHPRPWPWQPGFLLVLGHDLCLWLTPRLPTQLKRYIVRDALMHQARSEGKPAHEHPSGSASELLWAYIKK